MRKRLALLWKKISCILLIMFLTASWIPIQAGAVTIDVADHSVVDWKSVTSTFSDPYGDVNGAGPNDIVKLWVTADDANFYVRWDVILIGNNTQIKSSAYSIAMTTAVSDPGTVRPAKEVIGYVAFDSQSRSTVFLENSTKKVQLPSSYAQIITSGDTNKLVSVEVKFPFADFNSNNMTKNPITSTSIIPLWGQSLSSPSFNSSVKDSVPNTGYLSYDVKNNISTPRGTGPIPSLSVITTNTKAAPSSDINYVVTISNKGDVGDLTFNKVDFTLPSGFTYITDSTAGLTTSNPTTANGILTWSGSTTVSPGQSAILTFKARAAASAGTYYSNTAVVCTTPSGSIDSGDTAPVTIANCTIPGAPTVLQATDITQDSAVLSWTAPGAGTYTYNLYDGGILKASDISALSYNVTGLIPSSTHNFTVTAVSTDFVESTASNQVIVKVLDPTSVPDAPVLKAIVGKDCKVDLAWSQVDSAASYNVYMASTSGGYNFSQPKASGLTSTGCTITGLTNGTTYYFVVKAVNSKGEGSVSNELSAKPVALPSSAPTLSAISPSNNGNVQLSWSTVTGATSYNIYQYSKGSGNTDIYTPIMLGITDTSYTITGLADATYTFCVSASNSAGESGKSGTQAVTVSSQTPLAPVLNTANASDSSAALSWSAGTYAASYKVYSSTISGGPYTLVASDIVDRNYTATGLTNGTTYYFVVQSSNPKADSGYSNQLSATPILDNTSPTAGGGGALTAGNPTSSSVDLSWTAATDNVTAQAGLQYKVVYSTNSNIDTVSNAEDNGTVAQDWSTNLTSKNVTGLNSNTTYYFNVIVKDTTGNKTVYTTATGTTTSNIHPVSDFTNSSKTDTSASFTWTAANGATSIIIEQSPAGSNTWTTSTTGAIANNATSATVTGLNASTNYDFRLVVTGGTNAGNSNTLTLITQAAAPTIAPELTVAVSPGTAGGSTKASITGSAASKFIVNITDSSVGTVYVGDTAPAGTNYTSGANITSGVTAGKYLQVYDVDAQGKVVRFYEKQLVSGDIKAFSFTLSYTSGANGSISGTNPQTVEQGSDGAEVEAVPAAGYHFVSWSDGVATAKRTDASVNGNITVTSSFAINVYTVSFNSIGGSIIAAQSINHGGKASKPADPTKSGYTFGGWYKEVSLTNVFDFNIETITANTTIYTKWTQVPSTDNGRTNPPPQATTVTGSVIDGSTGTHVSNVTATVTADNSGNSTVSMNAAQAVVLREPDGSTSQLSDISKIAVKTEAGSPVTVSADGTIKVEGLAKGTDNNYNITYDLGNGQIITIGKLNVRVDSSGNVSLTSTLIDPYGVITDEKGKPIDGVNLTLYYADTERNRATGKIPGTIVPLPAIDGFKPNNNKNPQVSDASGGYGFMVFPNTDYYIVALKDGYNKSTSPVISVEKDLVKWNFRMHIAGVERLFGQNRVDTALEIAKAAFANTVSNVILATSENFPDALAGSVLAYRLNAPILLVGSSSGEQDKVLSYLKDNLDPAGTVYILGGTGAVSSGMESKVVIAGFKNIKRLGGADRYETSVKIAEELGLGTGTPVVIVSGENYPDALSISSTAAVKQYPILLVTKGEISNPVRYEVSKLNPGKVFIIGLQGVISTTVEDLIAQTISVNKTNIIRIGGTDRFKTSLETAKYFNLPGDIACVATGNNFPDALAGSIYGAFYKAPVILADLNLSDDVIAYLKEKKISSATIFGGEGAVGKNIFEQLSQMFNN